MKKILLGLLLASLIVPSLSWAALEAPETLEDAEQLGKEILDQSKEKIPQSMEDSWKNEVLPMWKKMAEIWSKWWDNTIQPWLIKVINGIKGLFGQEVEKRIPQVEKDFEEEKEELFKDIEKELPKAQPLWERIKALFEDLKKPEVKEN